jgi:hypothetical protein
MNGKFFALQSGKRTVLVLLLFTAYPGLLQNDLSFLWRDTLLLTVTVIIVDPIKLVNTFSIWHEF